MFWWKLLCNNNISICKTAVSQRSSSLFSHKVSVFQQLERCSVSTSVLEQTQLQLQSSHRVHSLIPPARLASHVTEQGQWGGSKTRCEETRRRRRFVLGGMSFVLPSVVDEVESFTSLKIIIQQCKNTLINTNLAVKVSIFGCLLMIVLMTAAFFCQAVQPLTKQKSLPLNLVLKHHHRFY